MEDLEERVVQSPYPETFREIRRMKKGLVEVRRAIWPARDAMNELLREPGLDKQERQKYLRVSDRAGEALLSLINDVLDLSRIEVGQVNLEEEPFDLREFVEGIMELMGYAADVEKVLQPSNFAVKVIGIALVITFQLTGGQGEIQTGVFVQN